MKIVVNMKSVAYEAAVLNAIKTVMPDTLVSPVLAIPSHIYLEDASKQDLCLITSNDGKVGITYKPHNYTGHLTIEVNLVTMQVMSFYSHNKKLLQWHADYDPSMEMIILSNSHGDSGKYDLVSELHTFIEYLKTSEDVDTPESVTSDATIPYRSAYGYIQ